MALTRGSSPAPRASSTRARSSSTGSSPGCRRRNRATPGWWTANSRPSTRPRKRGANTSARPSRLEERQDAVQQVGQEQNAALLRGKKLQQFIDRFKAGQSNKGLIEDIRKYLSVEATKKAEKAEAAARKKAAQRQQAKIGADQAEPRPDPGGQHGAAARRAPTRRGARTEGQEGHGGLRRIPHPGGALGPRLGALNRGSGPPSVDHDTTGRLGAVGQGHRHENPSPGPA